MLFAKNYNWQKKLILSASFVLFFNLFYAQSGFNLRWAIERQTGFESVYALIDSSYIVTGWTLDSLENSQVDFTLSHIDANGSVMINRSYESINSVTAGDCDSESRISNLFVQTKQTFVDNDLAFQLVWFQGNLDTLYSRIVFSPYLDSLTVSNAFLMPTFTIINDDSCTFFAAGIANSGSTANDFCIKKVSPSGDEMWTYILATEADPDGCYALLPTTDGGVIAATIQGPIGDSPAENKLIKLDRNGNETWTLINPGGYPKLINCIIADAEDVVLCGMHAGENNPPISTIAIVLKLDTLGNTHWVRTFGEYVAYIRKDFTNLVQTCDGNYVAGGTWQNKPGSEEIPEGQNDQDVDEFAYILKLDRESGAIIWERKYRFLEIYGDHHTLIDMKATLDGGVIFCGESRDSYQMLDAPYQQGWLVKLDECGCLVPGCDTLCRYVGCAAIDTTAYFPSVANQFIAGPVPATQFINIYFAGGDLDLAQTQFQMYDLQGRLVYSFVPDAANTTYMLSTEKFASGTYLLHLSHNGAKVQEQKIIIAEQ
jgi:hypothetical protein